MYEEIVNYFETNLCVENIYFRKHYKSWISGIVIVTMLEIIINYIISQIISNIWTRIFTILIIDFFITIIFLLLIYILPMIKIYTKKVNQKASFDPLGMLMGEEILSAYRDIEIQNMENFLRKKCKIKNVESISIILDLIDEEIQCKYEKKSFIDKYLNSIVLPLLILVLTVYFTNNNERQLSEIISKTIISIVTVVISGNFVFKIKNINITPVNKKQNLLELKRVLIDIMIKWNK